VPFDSLVLSSSKDGLAQGRRRRVESIDLVRGVIMILMALDHTRDFFGATGVNPTDPAQTTVALFFTRWVTHICAPVFFLLTGTGASLTLGRRSVGELSRLLFTRGVWLIVLELTVVRCLAFQFNFDYRVTMLLVLWALGWSMIALAALVHLPSSAVAAIGAAMIVFHNLFDAVRPPAGTALAAVWSILHRPGVILAQANHVVFVSYPLIPWIGVTASGFALGRLYREREDRQSFLLRAGVASTMAFVVLRWLNVYGDPAPWSAQSDAARTVLSFLNTTKYPPSLLFLLMTLGPAALLLAAFDGRTPRLLRSAVVFGRVPLFYFVAHLILIHLLATLVCLVRYGDAHWMFDSPRLGQYPFTSPPGWGYSLPIVYLVWVSVVVALYPLCRWYASVKQRRHDWWLSYL
jgi:uncharacterized membrane protein